jgi:cysteine desulfurase/selenocysteine lyase
MTTKIHFNCAGVAPLPFRVVLEVIKFLCHFYFLGPRSALLKYEAYILMLAEETAKLLNCSSEEISYLKNTSEGVIIAAESLPLDPGDEVLVMRCEYPANLIPWLRKRSDGIQVKVIEGIDSASSFRALLDSISKNTRAIAISWIQFSDGYVIDLKYLSRICREKNIFLVVDAVQIVGTRVVDLRDVDVDFLICGGHKHLMSLLGSGLIYIKASLLPVLKPFKVGIRSVKKFDSGGFELKDGASRFEDGTPNLLGIIALHSRIKDINNIGIKYIAQKTLELGVYYKDRLIKSGIGFIDYTLQGNIISIPVDNPSELMAHLETNGIFVRVINGRFIRISYSYLNKRRDINKFILVFEKYAVRQQPYFLNTERVLS